MAPILSILIPTVPERFAQAQALQQSILQQVGSLPVEVLSLCDNRMRSVGMKRQALLSISSGKYVAFCDDDDRVSEDYIATLSDMAKADVDVLCFNQSARWNDLQGVVEFRINHQPFAPFVPGGITRRFPWHSCAWRNELAKACVFTDKNWGEDADWVRQAHELAVTEAYSPKTLHFYDHQDGASLALDSAQKA